MLKSGARILAIDDGPLTQNRVPCVGIVARLHAPDPESLVEGVLIFRVTRDGDDSTRELVRAVKRSRFASQLKGILVNSITLAGLNLLDLTRVNRELGVPVLAVTKKAPRPGELARALRSAGKLRRQALLERAGETHLFRAGHFHVRGIGPAEARRLLESFVGYPWPLRLAHLFATALASGESHGRA